MNHELETKILSNTIKEPHLEPSVEEDEAALLCQIKKESKRRIGRVLSSGMLAIALVSAGSTVAAQQISNNKNAELQETAATKKDRSVDVEAAIEAGFVNYDPLFASTPSFLENYTTSSSSSLDTDVWNYAIGNGTNGWGNKELEYYTSSPENVKVENGSLIIKALRENQGDCEYTSARIDTKGKQTFEYGKLEVIAKMPEGVGTWPAIWLLPEDNEYVSSPEIASTTKSTDDGEIDMAEAIGRLDDTVYTVVHTISETEKANTGSHVENSSTEFHAYTLEWTPQKIVFLIDGKKVYKIAKKANDSYREWPFDQPFYLIIDQAVGGKWAKARDFTYGKDGVDNTALPSQLNIKSIAYYPYKGQYASAEDIEKLRTNK